MAEAATDYDRAMEIARGGDTAAREALAADPATWPEFLFYLADDKDVTVRRAVASNPSTPGKADVILSRDSDISVRCAVARKIVGEGLDPAKRRDMWRMGYTILETLLHDSVLKVRRILSDALKSDPQAPHGMVVGLARDKEEEVAFPVLRSSPVLTDDDMITIIRDGAPDWAQKAIAGRESVSSAVSDVLIGKGSTEPVATVIANPGSSLTDSALDGLVDRSATIKEWQAPLVERPSMAGGLLVKLAKFVAGPLLTVLCGRSDIDSATAGKINAAIETRSDEPRVRAVPSREQPKPKPKSAAATGGRATAKAQPVSRLGQGETPETRARRLHEAGGLTDSAVALALDKWENEFVIAALALRAGLRTDTVRRMVNARSARTMVALSWKAGFSARFSMDLQRQLASIPPPKMLNARDGIDYPLTPAEMKEQLSLFV